MKKMLHKIFSILLAACFILSAVPAPAAAAENTPANEVTNGSYVDGDWKEGGNGSVEHTIDGTKVTLSKTATVVGENTFDITLKVQTSTTTTSSTAGGAVVLVIDTSSSMTQSVSGTDRIKAAKAAARDFLASYAGSDASAKRMLAIVSFNSGASTPLSWVNVAGGANQNQYNDALNAINGLGTSRGTNMEAGLNTATSLVGNSAVSGLTKSVVLLSDGAPTASSSTGGGWGGGWGDNEAHCNAAATAAASVKASATLYTVCFGAARDNAYGSVTVSEFLKNRVASSTSTAYDADDADQLNAAFKAISESITSGLSGEGWTATDPMADMISVTSGTGENFSGSDGTYTWKLSDAVTSTNGNVTTYTYTYTYRVTLDVQGQNFEEGKYFPTNEPTYLHVGDKQYAFPVPGVKGVLPRTNISVNKVWDDNENQDGMRATSVEVKLQKKVNDVWTDVEGATATLNADNSWTHTWDGKAFDLIAKSKNQVHEYQVVETEVPAGYTPTPGTADNDFTVINTHVPEKISISGTKTWADNNNQDGKRPGSITIHLFADGTEVDSKTVTANDNWAWSFTDLDKYAGGKEIVYTITEDTVENYTTEVEGYNVTNTHAPEKTSVSMNKIWEDNFNQDGKRPESITVNLKANGEVVATATVTGDSVESTWRYTFEDLDKYANGKEIEYSVEEVNVDPNYTAQNLTPFSICNFHTPEKTSVSMNKIWEDNFNQDGKRPVSVTINLKANGEVVATATVTGDSVESTWRYTFEDLDKYANGKEIEYSVEEVNVDPNYTAQNLTPFSIRNFHTPEKTSVTVTKEWNDNDDQDGKRPESITVSLLADSNETGKTLTLSTANNWTASFTDLDKYAAGEEIAYTVAESEVAGYELEGITATDTGYTITNFHEIEKTSVSGSKTWADNDDQDGKRPESITINLKANGEVVATKTVTADNNWAWTFENLDKYAQGEEIVYTISEGNVEGYVPSYTDFDVTNTYKPEKTSVSVTKVWKDDSNRDNIRPADITVKLLADGKATNKTLTLSSGNDWTATFEDLDKYANKGTEIVYTVEEVKVDGYTTEITGTAAEGFTVTNTHSIETVAVEGSKTWDDKKNQDGIRPESITINLKANGKTIESKTVTEADDWAWSFTNLPKNENGTAITYSISEDAVEGYTAEIKGYDVTNSYTPATTAVHVTKVWLDKDNQDGIRPDDITVTLVADGEETNKTLTLSADNQWTGSFKDLDKFADGVEIKYTVKETTVEGYESEYEVKADGITITNTHEPEVIEQIAGKKTWNDANNQDGKRPESITVKLLANGQEVRTQVVSEKESWIYSFENLPKFEAGEEIIYTVVENEVPGYSATYSKDNYNITNSYTPETINIKVSKSWVDSNDADGIRPTKVTIYLYANGEKTGDKLVLTKDEKWTGSFTDLPKYEDGKEIKYTIAEKDVKGYNAVIKGSAGNGFTVTNSHNSIPKTGDERTPILWIAMMLLAIIVVFFASRPFFYKKGKYSR